MKKFLVIAVIVVALSSLGFAQSDMENISIGLKGGVATYFGDIDEQHISPYFGFHTDAWLSQRFTLGGLIYAGQLQAEKSPRYFKSNILSVAAMLKFVPFGKSTVSPYLTGGMEGYKINPENNAGEKLPNNLGNVYSRVRLGYPVGAGFMFFLNEGLSLDIEGLYHISFTDYLDDLAVGSKDDAFATASIGLTWHLGGPKDTDGDGIPDKLDKDPLRAEDFDGFMDSDGAPDLDNDQDGIPDSQDKAPLQAEDRDGYQDNDGVPDPDNDGDGILDVNDKAPMQAEDMDGFQDKDGVPDLDNDGDGIADAIDKCPNKAETVNGYEDSDGCPDTKPEVVVEKGKSIVLEGVHFRSGSAVLTPDSKTVLDKVVRTLRDNQEIKVEIQGYTDNTGRLQTNYVLSEKRAQAVKDYLVKNGIESTRISTKGFGPEKPIAPNSTREGRAKNRRIEFYRIK